METATVHNVKFNVILSSLYGISMGRISPVEFQIENTIISSVNSVKLLGVHKYMNNLNKKHLNI